MTIRKATNADSLTLAQLASQMRDAAPGDLAPESS